MNPTKTFYTYKLTGKDGLIEFGSQTFSNAQDAENVLSDKIQKFDCYASGCLVEIKEHHISSRYKKLSPEQFGDICDSKILLTSRMMQNVYNPVGISASTIQLKNLFNQNYVTLDANSAVLVEFYGDYRLEARSVETGTKYEFNLYRPVSSKDLDFITKKQ